MHLVITNVKAKPDSLDQAKAVFEKHVPQLGERYTGWRGAQFSVDRERNRVVVIGSWEDPEQMRSFLAAPAYKEIIGEFSQYFDGSPEVTVTEVVSRVGPQ